MVLPVVMPYILMQSGESRNEKEKEFTTKEELATDFADYTDSEETEGVHHEGRWAVGYRL